MRIDPTPEIRAIVDAQLACGRFETEEQVIHAGLLLLQNEAPSGSPAYQLQRLELLGQLTGGIAHDFNNMLAVIIGGLNLVQRKLARGERDVSRFVDTALDGATRATALTQRLLAFSRRQPLMPQAVDINDLLVGMEDLFSSTLGKAVTVIAELDAKLWATTADISELENALLNLAVNARDAMPTGGRLTIETSNVSIDDADAHVNEIAAGDYLLIAVTDTGTGMTPDVLERVFEPLFTTKPPGRGTGLGLSQVFGFVRQSNGAVKISSELGHGTTVRLYLPRRQGVAEANAPHSSDAVAIAPRGDAIEIILVVEDEERVRTLIVETLRDLGYTVLHTDSGVAALQVLDTDQYVSLLLTDIVMPEITGQQLAKEARSRRPEIKVIYATGNTHDETTQNGVIESGTNYLLKPFTIERLATLVRSTLDET